MEISKTYCSAVGARIIFIFLKLFSLTLLWNAALEEKITHLWNCSFLPGGIRGKIWEVCKMINRSGHQKSIYLILEVFTCLCFLVLYFWAEEKLARATLTLNWWTYSSQCVTSSWDHWSSLKQKSHVSLVLISRLFVTAFVFWAFKMNQCLTSSQVVAIILHTGLSCDNLFPFSACLYEQAWRH